MAAIDSDKHSFNKEKDLLIRFSMPINIDWKFK